MGYGIRYPSAPFFLIFFLYSLFIFLRSVLHHSPGPLSHSSWSGVPNYGSQITVERGRTVRGHRRRAVTLKSRRRELVVYDMMFWTSACTHSHFLFQWNLSVCLSVFLSSLVFFLSLLLPLTCTALPWARCVLLFSYDTKGPFVHTRHMQLFYIYRLLFSQLLWGYLCVSHI